jgi:hypothetical protein
VTEAPEATFLVIGTEEDPICRALRMHAGTRGLRARLIEPDRLGEVSVVLDEAALHVDREQITALFFGRRSHGDFSGTFRAEDRVFVDVEIAGVWLAATQLPSVRCVNRYDAQAWYAISPWAPWRSRLGAAGVSTASIAIGADTRVANPSWLPYTESALRPLPADRTRRLLASPVVNTDGVREHLVVVGEPFGSHRLARDDPIAQAAHTLAHHGIHFAQVTTNRSGDVIAVDTTPNVTDSILADWAAQRLVRWLLS